MNINYPYVLGGLLLCGVFILIVIDLRAGFCLRDKGCDNGQYCKYTILFVLPCPRCIDLCEDDSMCGENARCTAKDHQEVCECKEGFIGDPTKGCTPSGTPVTCEDTCGPNTSCNLYSGTAALCGCKSGFSGDPYDRNSGCTASKTVDAARCYSEDMEDQSADCASFFAAKPKKVFKIVKDNKADWFEAHKLCRNEKQLLAIIENRADQEDLENKLISEDLHDAKLWLAGSDLKLRNKFQWVTGTMFNSILYTDWNSEEPAKDGVRHCVAQNKAGWVTARCEEMNMFVCMNVTKT